MRNLDPETMNDLSRAEAYRDHLHDLPNGYDPATERAIQAVAIDLATHVFDKMDKEKLFNEWLENHWPDYRDAAIDELGLL